MYEANIAQLKVFEGCVPWMYLDAAGNVTVGIGLMLPSAERAAQLAFHAPSDPQPASTEEIMADWLRVKQMPPNHLPPFYERLNGLILLPTDIEALCREHLAQDEAFLRDLFPSYDNYPDGCRQALLDMAFNLGHGVAGPPPTGFHEFKHLIAAVTVGDWKLAAAECTRRGIQAERNSWTQNQFLAAAHAA